MKYVNLLYLGILLSILTSCNEVFDNEWRASKDARGLSLSSNTLSFSSDAQSKNLEVRSENISWGFHNNASWLSFSPSSGSSSTIVTTSVQENVSDTARTAFTQLSPTEANLPFSNQLTVSQAAQSTYIHVSEHSLVFDGIASEKQVLVMSNREWVFSKSDSWISVSRNGNNLIVSVTTNDESGARDGYVTLTAGNINEQIHITQRVANVTSTISSLEFGNVASSQDVVITADADWTLECAQSWINVIPTSGHAGNTTLTVSVTDNPNGTGREGFIYIYVGRSRKLEIAVKQDGVQLSVAPTELSFGPEASLSIVNVTANMPWSLIASDTWIHLDRTSGIGNASVSVSVDSSDGQQRIGYINLLGKDGNLINRIIVTQNAVAFNASPSLVTFGVEGGEEFVAVTSNINWKANISAEWLLLAPSTGSKNATINIKATENTSSEVRTTEVVFTDDKGHQRGLVSVSQSAVSFNATPAAITFPVNGGDDYIKVKTNIWWKASTETSWLHLATTSGNSDGEFKVTADANHSNSDRSGIIVFANRMGDIIQSISVSQVTTNLSANPSSIYFAVEGEEHSITVTANSDWTLNAPAWIELSQTSGTGTSTLRAKAGMNTGTSMREDVITLKNGVGEKVQDIKVSQDAYKLEVSPSMLTFGNPTASKQLIVTSNSSWTAYSSAQWLTIARTSGYGNENVIVTVESNVSHDSRSAEITFTAGTLTTTILVNQEGEKDYSDFTRDLGYIFPSAGGTLSVSSFEDVDWAAKVTNGSSWIKLSPETGSSGQPLQITTADNSSGNHRVGEIQISYGYNRYTCPVVQSGKKLDVNVSSIDFFAKGGTSGAITITADLDATITSNSPWAKVTRTGNTFTITTDKNTTTSYRTATITITLPGISDSPTSTVDVHQAGVNGAFNFGGFDSDEKWN